eukprot:TRINITY_DN23149_c0_g1_i1.p1 TRINITY_DN23149_c0_g1~~TRINITY_DN23149_c0_g1_i1.p1  ORF type:complete len:238 (+),score=42.49 TRINITY_DN23149_c0_g1_i1:173-886(+)
MAISKEPTLNPIIFGVVTFLGVAAASLALAAEESRVKNYTYLMDALSQFHCKYPDSNATPLAIASVFSLAAGQFITTWHTGNLLNWGSAMRYDVSRIVTIAVALAVLSWVFFITATIMLILAAVENTYHTSATAGSFAVLKCSVVEEGTFIAAAVLTFLSIALVEVYYYLGVKAQWEIWRTSGGYNSATPEGDTMQLQGVPPSKALSTVAEEPDGMAGAAPGEQPKSTSLTEQIQET